VKRAGAPGSSEGHHAPDSDLQRLIKAAEVIVAKFPKGTGRVVALRQ
jgi:hypothetical protein